jgi:hypothetical protein
MTHGKSNMGWPYSQFIRLQLCPAFRADLYSALQPLIPTVTRAKEHCVPLAINVVHADMAVLVSVLAPRARNQRGISSTNGVSVNGCSNQQ